MMRWWSKLYKTPNQHQKSDQPNDEKQDYDVLTSNIGDNIEQ